MAVVDVDLFNYHMCVHFLVSARAPGALTTGPVRYDNTSATALELGGPELTTAIPHDDCALTYRLAPDNACVAGAVTLPTPLRASACRVKVNFAPLAHDTTWRGVRLDVITRIAEGRIRNFSTRWSSLGTGQ